MGNIIKEIIVDRMEILEDGQIQVRTATVIKEDGVELTRSFHRHVVEPDSDITNEDDKVKNVHNAVCTQQVKAAYIAKKSAKAAGVGGN